MSALTTDEITSLKVLAYFFYRTGKLDSAARTARALLAAAPQEAWARHFLVLCSDAKGDFAKVESLTDDPENIPSDKNQAYALKLVRARALQKLGRTKEASELMQQMSEDFES